MAPSARLGAIRVIVVLCALMNVVFQNFDLFAQAAGPWYQAPGFFHWIPYQIGELLFNSVTALIVLKAALIFFLISALLGFCTGFSLFVSTALYCLYLGTLRENTWSLDNGMLPLYLMFVMVWIPSGEGVSIDQGWRKEYAHLKLDDRPSLSMGWSIFLVRAVIAFSYFQSGVLKLHNTGFSWIRPWQLANSMIRDSMTFSHLQQIPHLTGAPETLWVLLACAYLGLELFFPLLLFVRNLRPGYLLAAILVRGIVLAPQNIFFDDLILLLFVFFDWDRILPLVPVSSYDRRKTNFFFRFRKAS